MRLLGPRHSILHEAVESVESLETVWQSTGACAASLARSSGTAGTLSISRWPPMSTKWSAMTSVLSLATRLPFGLVHDLPRPVCVALDHQIGVVVTSELHRQRFDRGAEAT